MKIKRTDSNGQEMVITLTEEEKEQVYREVLNEYRLEDAKNHLVDHFFGTYPGISSPMLEQFERQNGHSFFDLIEPDSDLYVLQDIADLFGDAHDCNVPENDLYENIIADYCQHHPVLSQFRLMEELEVTPIREAEVQRMMKDTGWGREDCLETLEELTDMDIQTGYFICVTSGSESLIDGAKHIERIDILARFESDYEAAKQAEKDGIQIIHDIPGLEDWIYVDTPENRAICEKALQQKSPLDMQIKAAQSEVKPVEREGESLHDRAR